jgi:SHS2 domain-containing protein
MYEYFEHTADLGVRVHKNELPDLFAESAKAVFAAIVDNIEDVRDDRRFIVDIEGADLEYLLYDWLKELLYLFDVEHVLFSRFEVDLRPGGLRGSAYGEDIDPNKHILAHEVKAITYHGLTVRRENAGWLAEFIVDI